MRFFIKQARRRVKNCKNREIDKKETDKDKIKSILETLKNQDNPLNDKTEISIKDNEFVNYKIEIKEIKLKKKY